MKAVRQAEHLVNHADIEAGRTSCSGFWRRGRNVPAPVDDSVSVANVCRNAESPWSSAVLKEILTRSG